MSGIADVIKEFVSHDFKFQDRSAASEVTALGLRAGFNAQELASTWELFYLNRQLGTNIVKLEHVESFKPFLEQERKAKERKQAVEFHVFTKPDIDDFWDTGEMKNGMAPSKMETDDPEPVDGANYIMRTPLGKDLMGSCSVPTTPASSSKPPKRALDGVFAMGVTGTGGGGLPPQTPATPFSKRDSKLSVVTALNEHLGARNDDPMDEDGVVKRRRVGALHPCDLQSLGAGVGRHLRYMFDSIDNRVEALDSRIRKLVEELHLRGFDMPEKVFRASQEQGLFVGRICCDGEGRLNMGSVLLEGHCDSEHSNGHRVKVDLREIDSFSIFPGQIVGIEGRNPSGHCLVASRVIHSVPLPRWNPKEGESKTQSGSSVGRGNLSRNPRREGRHRELRSRHQGERLTNGKTTSTEPVSIVVASGPFSTSDNLLYEPLQDIFKYAMETRPNVLILLGPFVDSEHPSIKSGEVDMLFEHVFQKELRTRVESYCEKMGENAQVVLMPSTRDAHHDAIFPQPPFSSEDFEDPDNQILLLSNPGVLRCNEVTIAMSTHDILRHLSGEEASRSREGEPVDRMSRIASHIIGQRSFYPLFPPVQGSLLDMSVAPEALELPFTPHILVLPSDLHHFAKILTCSSPQVLDCCDSNENTRNGGDVKCEEGSTVTPDGRSGNNAKEKTSYGVDGEQRDGVRAIQGNEGKSYCYKRGDSAPEVRLICINPGRLVKGRLGGSFARIEIYPVDGNSGSTNDLQARTKVEILRI